MRSGIVKVRVSAQEKAAIKAAAADAGLSVSDLLRRAAALPPVRPAVHPNIAELVQLRRELNSIGNNMNQLTAAANAGRVDADFRPALKKVGSKVERAVDAVQKEIER